MGLDSRACEGGELGVLAIKNTSPAFGWVELWSELLGVHVLAASLASLYKLEYTVRATSDSLVWVLGVCEILITAPGLVRVGSGLSIAAATYSVFFLSL